MTETRNRRLSRGDPRNFYLVAKWKRHRAFRAHPVCIKYKGTLVSLERTARERERERGERKRIGALSSSFENSTKISLDHRNETSALCFSAFLRGSRLSDDRDRARNPAVTFRFKGLENIGHRRGVLSKRFQLDFDKLTSQLDSASRKRGKKTVMFLSTRLGKQIIRQN